MKAEPTQQNFHSAGQDGQLQVTGPKSYSRASTKVHFPAFKADHSNRLSGLQRPKYPLTDRNEHLWCIKDNNNFLSAVLCKVGEIFISQMTQFHRYFVLQFVYICPSHKLAGLLLISLEEVPMLQSLQSLITEVMEFLKFWVVWMRSWCLLKLAGSLCISYTISFL